MEKENYCAIGSQPSIKWCKASNAIIVDNQGREYIDFSSGCLIANSGHGNSQVSTAITECVQAGLLSTYGFGNPWKEELLELLADISPFNETGVHLLSTGSEAVEFALKIALSTPKRIENQSPMIVSFEGGFHGRTLGAQYAGGSQSLKEWIPQKPFVSHVLPFPRDPSELAQALNGLRGTGVAGLIFEPYIGGTVEIFCHEALKEMRDFCTEEGALLIADEVQSGCFRTGHLFFSCRTGVVPDVLVLGKGVSSSVPLSVVLTKADLLRRVDPSTVSSTHGGNALSCAAGLANLRFLVHSNISSKVLLDGDFAIAKLNAIKTIASQASISGAGLVYGVDFKWPGVAASVVETSIASGLMLFNPVGPNKSTVKLSPPLTIQRELLDKGIRLFLEAVAIVMSVDGA
ncbi:aminotransferase class III-fold pyridoxal phosphate-dependent enzyme [Stutzerimonas nitrititolerans]|uniref:aminotransferase class III-fold pyridoxal phosphate-dependent enzyme n=1 Tax=Stutzerimonas nitrititolerans TaxID=2482751 RepID=UPI0028A1F166|nr:aminotransferase class III-fold pyridoxal phosphate-dependent enzyme [Stutzerimonas nitrititolerans]